ncbi:MAG: thioredoxin fold domain-containing protein [Chromatiaceae bacterium]|nr:thioredoxin fold domain-containing protein [Gammaproteobacteria bacterium]MCP5298230.1 thioredoxin fold domain-containing protein [Chromatiaceae bacterium]MCP5423230.1 thioredoxin fold domain-containing protein [Chromatiaceae bacterium]
MKLDPKRFAPYLVLSIMLPWLGATRADPPGGWQFLPFDQALRKAQQEQRRVFLYFGRHGCPSCEKTNRESFSDPRVVEHFNAHYVLAYVDSESGERLRLPSGERITEMELGVRLKVFGTPFFYFMEPDGGAILRAPGYQSADEFLRYDRFVNEGHYKQRSFAEFKAADS